MGTLQNTETFQQVVEQFHQPLYRYFAVHTSGDLSCAQEMTMETFSVLYRKPISLEKQTFASWLFGIAWDVLNANYGCEGVDRFSSVSRSLEDEDEHVNIRQVLKVLSSLTFYSREALCLRLLAGLDVRDIAILMDKNDSSIKVIVYQGLLEFASRLGGLEYRLPNREQLLASSQSVHLYVQDVLQGNTQRPTIESDVVAVLERLLSLREIVSMKPEDYSALVSHVRQFTSATRL